MKRFLTCLLAAGLILAFSMPVLAVDVKFSGTFVFEGWMEGNRNLRDDSQIPKAPNTSFMDHYMFLTTEFKVAEGVTITTRAHILDNVFGDISSQGRAYTTNQQLASNIEIDYAYVDMKFGPGFFQIGETPNGWGVGTIGFTNYPTSSLRYCYTPKNWFVMVSYEKVGPGASVVSQQGAGGSTTLQNVSDGDYTRDNFLFIYFGNKWEAGHLLLWDRANGGQLSGVAYSRGYFIINSPYVKGTFGPVYIEAQIYYTGGTIDLYPANQAVAGDHLNISNWVWHFKGQYTAGPMYGGLMYTYVGGNDPNHPGMLGAFVGSGREYKPCLILINPDRDKYLGALGPSSVNATMGINNNYYGGTVPSNGSSAGSNNFSLYQGYLGFKPIPKLDLFASVTYAKLNEKPLGWISDNLGTEVDVTASYKLYDNVSYMVGFGFLFTGDAWKGTNQNAATDNDWLLMHRLTISF